MRALCIDDRRLALDVVDDPELSDDTVIVEVEASGLNAADLRQIEGRYPAPPGWPAQIPGLEVAGTVRAAGASVTDLRVGDRVMGLIGGGGHAEQVRVPAGLLVPVPDHMEIVDAAAFPEAFVTAWDALIAQAGLGIGERVLVTGAGGGVGTAAVQIAAAAGATVVASVRTPRVRDLLADEIDSPGVTVIAPDDEADHGPYDVILDLVSGPTVFERITWVLPRGRVLLIGSAAPAPADARGWIGHAMMHRVRVLGSTIRGRSNEEKSILMRDVARSLLPLIADGRLRTVVDAVYPLREHAEAFDRLAAPGKLGKIVLAMR